MPYRLRIQRFCLPCYPAARAISHAPNRRASAAFQQKKSGRWRVEQDQKHENLKCGKINVLGGSSSLRPGFLVQLESGREALKHAYASQRATAADCRSKWPASRERCSIGCGQIFDVAVGQGGDIFRKRTQSTLQWATRCGRAGPKAATVLPVVIPARPTGSFVLRITRTAASA